MLSSGMMLNLPGCVFWGILLLLHTADCGRFDIIVPRNQILAEVGETIILPCYIKSRISAENMIVEWVRQGRFVHRYREGRDDNENQDPSFRTRTALFIEELKTGIVSLKLLRVKGTDEGSYNCSVMSPTMNWQDDSNIKVDVKAVGSHPLVSIEGHRGTGMGLVCETQGWYPEPQMEWLNSKGVPLSADPPETTTDSVGRYTLILRVIVQKTDRNRFNCRVQQKYMEIDGTAWIYVPDALFYQDHTWKWVLAVVFGVSTLALAVVICFLVKRNRHQTSIIHEKDKIIKKNENLSRQLDLVNTKGYQDYEVVRRHAVEVTLDPETAHPRLILSADGKQVRYGVEQQNLPKTLKRYDRCPDVLGRQGFSSGKFYYEVQVNNKTEWHLGVAKETCQRVGEVFLRSDKGYWTIRRRKGKYQATTDILFHLHLSQEPQKVGVFVDYEECTVSFYNVEAKCHIYSFTGCCFQEKLHPFFSPGFPDDSGENSDPLIICPVDDVKTESPHLSESHTDLSDSAHRSESQADLSDSAHMSESQAVESDSAHLSESQAVESNSAHLSESQTNESHSGQQSLLNQGHQSESSEEINESVRLLEQSASYKV
ncbi:butyrophilin subfamily 1 member A1-like isoform X2 [Hypomesus transpacificus]|uniref:butyrophilin subfamily 1 member A1-like isoform X2 n=1 Tax=Hypomesus transpacificus TaxID=137520 RepID=UPI001F07E979|nr:butyrophilin subfamily 1 member A1-like isoform X2 [Hypomesus transpacificus]